MSKQAVESHETYKRLALTLSLLCTSRSIRERMVGGRGVCMYDMNDSFEACLN